MQEIINTNYDYQGLVTFFEDIASPQEMASHLDQLLFFLVYYNEKEGCKGFYEMYCDIFEFKRVLQNMIKAS